MEELTKAEERIMQVIWDLDKCFVHDILEKITDEPKPPYNTVASVVRLLEQKGYLGYKAYGRTYEYFPLVSKDDYGKRTFRKVLSNYFDNSAASLLSFMVKEEKLSAEEIQQLRAIIERGNSGVE